MTCVPVSFTCYQGCAKCTFDWIGKVKECVCPEGQELDGDWHICVQALPKPIPLQGDQSVYFLYLYKIIAPPTEEPVQCGNYVCDLGQICEKSVFFYKCV